MAVVQVCNRATAFPCVVGIIKSGQTGLLHAVMARVDGRQSHVRDGWVQCNATSRVRASLGEQYMVLNLYDKRLHSCNF